MSDDYDKELVAYTSFVGGLSRIRSSFFQEHSESILPYVGTRFSFSSPFIWASPAAGSDKKAQVAFYDRYFFSSSSPIRDILLKPYGGLEKLKKEPKGSVNRVRYIKDIENLNYYINSFSKGEVSGDELSSVARYKAQEIAHGSQMRIYDEEHAEYQRQIDEMNKKRRINLENETILRRWRILREQAGKRESMASGNPVSGLNTSSQANNQAITHL